MRELYSKHRMISSGAVAMAAPGFVEKVGLSLLVQGEYSSRQCIPPHWHGVAHCTYVYDGSYVEARFGEEELVQKGDLRFHPRGEVHSNVICRGGARCLNIEFLAGDALTPALEAISRRVSDFAGALERNAKDNLNWSLPEELRSRYAPAFVRADAARKFQALVETFLWTQIEKHLPPWLSRCIRELTEKTPQATSLSDLAELGNVHPTHVIRAFRSYLGQTPRQYLRSRRVKLACELLVKSTSPLTNIAFACGFYDQAHFSHVFRAFTGVTPGQFRAEHRVGR